MKERAILQEKIELSDVVMHKTNQVLDQIRNEKQTDTKRYRRAQEGRSRSRIAAAVGLCLLAISGVSAGAAIHHYWGRGMNGNLQANDTQQQQLVEDGMAVVYPEQEDYESMKVTQNGVTVAPNTVICDEHFAYITFTISGYDLAEGKEPGFETADISADGMEVNSFGSMYNGIVAGEDGKPVYEDGKPTAFAEDGTVVERYLDDKGNLEYAIELHTLDETETMLGKTIRVDFHNLGTLDETVYHNVLDGTWNFEMKLPDEGSAKTFELNKTIAGTDYEITNVELSPVSVKAEYVKAGEFGEGDQEIPVVKGVVLKDGTKLPYLTNGGMNGYYKDGTGKAYNLYGYDRVINVDEVQALLIMPFEDGELITVDVQ